MTADLILTGGRVRTMDPLPFAKAVAIGGGRVLAVGSAANVAVLPGRGRWCIICTGAR
jgi:predicted amidohydrolase YtcJ